MKNSVVEWLAIVFCVLGMVAVGVHGPDVARYIGKNLPKSCECKANKCDCGDCDCCHGCNKK